LTDILVPGIVGRKYPDVLGGGFGGTAGLAAIIASSITGIVGVSCFFTGGSQDENEKQARMQAGRISFLHKADFRLFSAKITPAGPSPKGTLTKSLVYDVFFPEKLRLNNGFKPGDLYTVEYPGKVDVF
jgi:hypothetical protein